MVPSASAIAAVIRKVSTSPVEFVQRIEKAGGKNKGSGDSGGGLVLPSSDFQRLCIEQLDLFRRILHPDALLSVRLVYFPLFCLIKDLIFLVKVCIFVPDTVVSFAFIIGFC